MRRVKSGGTSLSPRLSPYPQDERHRRHSADTAQTRTTRSMRNNGAASRSIARDRPISDIVLKSTENHPEHICRGPRPALAASAPLCSTARLPAHGPLPSPARASAGLQLHNAVVLAVLISPQPTITVFTRQGQRAVTAHEGIRCTRGPTMRPRRWAATSAPGLT